MSFSALFMWENQVETSALAKTLLVIWVEGGGASSRHHSILKSSNHTCSYTYLLNFGRFIIIKEDFLLLDSSWIHAKMRNFSIAKFFYKYYYEK